MGHVPDRERQFHRDQEGTEAERSLLIGPGGGTGHPSRGPEEVRQRADRGRPHAVLGRSGGEQTEAGPMPLVGAVGGVLWDLRLRPDWSVPTKRVGFQSAPRDRS